MYEQFDKQIMELDNLKWATLRLSEDIRFLKEENIKFSSKNAKQDKYISSLTTSFEERLENNSVNNRDVRNTAAEKSVIEATVEMKLDEIKYNHTKIFDYFGMKISAITL